MKYQDFYLDIPEVVVDSIDPERLTFLKEAVISAFRRQLLLLGENIDKEALKILDNAAYTESRVKNCYRLQFTAPPVYQGTPISDNQEECEACQ